MPIEYNSKPAIRKMKDDRYKDGVTYELIWNVNSSVLSVLTKEQMLELRDAIDRMISLPRSKNDIHYFPVMRYRITG